MKIFDNGVRMVEDESELPDLRGAKLLFADFETTSGDDRLDSLNPWHHCWATGVGVTVDDEPGAWYVPVRHRHGINVRLEAARSWWQTIQESVTRWVNHNVKYDAHVSALDFGWLPDWPEQDLYCTLAHAKVLDSDRGFGRGGYELDALSRDWLHEDISAYYNALQPWLFEAKDYGRIPSEVMAPYGGQDALTVRRLYHYLEARIPEECSRVSQMETDLTSVLLAIERAGMRVDPIELAVAEIAHSTRLLDIDREIYRITGRSVNWSSNDQIYDLLVNQYGLPILAWTEEDDDGNPAGNPSFDKEALKMYSLHPHRPRGSNGEEVVGLIQEARTLSQLLGLFVRPYQELAVMHGDDHFLHPSFNQMVRTGRMSCKEPNMQQLSELAKRLIHPRRGGAFLSYDQSQIEFRVIVHYIQNQRCIDAYLRDPDTDFHDWMAEAAKIKRKPAKTLNFMMGYGGGKKKTVRTLSVNVDVVGDVDGEVARAIESRVIAPQQREDMIARLCKERAEGVYDDYHRALPELKPTSRRAAAVCYDRGYVRNVHGRRRHLPQDKSHHAFNTLCQGEAADIQKERTVAAHRACLGTPIEIVGNVHDSVVFDGPEEVMRDPRTQAALCWILETPDVPLKVPLRCKMGLSTTDWAEADKSASSVHYDVASINKENPLWFLK